MRVCLTNCFIFLKVECQHQPSCHCYLIWDLFKIIKFVLRIAMPKLPTWVEVIFSRKSWIRCCKQICMNSGIGIRLTEPSVPNYVLRVKILGSKRNIRLQDIATKWTIANEFEIQSEVLGQPSNSVFQINLWTALIWKRTIVGSCASFRSSSWLYWHCLQCPDQSVFDADWAWPPFVSPD